ncbi:alpha/beta hydrolase [Rhodococcus sp. IEGM 1370]|uniref:alpha/beta fold hydrolase n=1 Tax=Rhodococcus sp. IEGM 1370 TaxID=3082222 RepID=UPI002953A1D0|nr:alpha/beta hydrolase [Rhodococcus sp. IEGM 1370]MDV8075227.1 alpha/beta hydrolase [Rhodococcus sp. IEGM 1370]
MERTIQKSVPVSGGSWVNVDVYGNPDLPGLLILPGVMSDARSWAAVARSVNAWPSVTVVNRRGRRPSGPLTAEYSIGVEVDDLVQVLSAIPEPVSIFGWSYGGLITLLAADEHPVEHLIAYEPVLPPFARHALSDLKEAAAQSDRGRSVEIVNLDISGFSAEHVDILRADAKQWEALCELAEPLYDELSALDAAHLPDVLAGNVERVDLIIGQHNRSIEPYGTSFDRISRRIPNARVHQLDGNGHLAHIESPGQLGRFIDATLASV